jgi:O-antigen/teichoic acid export membrane protein
LHLERKTARINIINATFNILLNLWAIQNFGLLGAAFMTVATEALGLVQFMVLLRGHLAVSRVLKELLSPILPVIFMAGLLILLGELPVFLEIPVAGGFYLLALVLTGSLPFTDVKRVFQMVVARFAFAFRRLAPTK